MDPKRMVEYTFLRQSTSHPVGKIRFSVAIFLALFQVAFIVCFAFFSKHVDYQGHVENKEIVPRLYSMFMDVHTMMFVGFGFLMTFLKRYGYSSLGFNFLIAAFVLEWALLIRGWLEQGIDNIGSTFTISIENLLVADFCAAAVLISFGAVIGKASLSQLVFMATFEVVIQGVNEFVGVHYLKAYDVGESMYVHVFGAYFGLTVAKILNNKEIESKKESAVYHSDFFAMIGTLFLWLYWPSFNSATAKDEGQIRAIVNTYMSITASCITTFVISMMVGKGKLDMVHIQNATLAGGVAIGTIADMAVQPYGAMIVGSIAGILSTLGYEFLSPVLKRINLHDTCGVNNLHGMPGLLSGIAGAIVAAIANRQNFNGDRLYTFYPSRIPVKDSAEYFELNLNATEFKDGGLGRTATMQGGYQMAALGVTLGMAIVGGAITGFLMKLPILESISNEDDMFDDEPCWKTPDDYSLRLAEVKMDIPMDETINQTQLSA